jgi:hypothetical protein
MGGSVNRHPQNGQSQSRALLGSKGSCNASRACARLRRFGSRVNARAARRTSFVRAGRPRPVLLKLLRSPVALRGFFLSATGPRPRRGCCVGATPGLTRGRGSAASLRTPFLDIHRYLVKGARRRAGGSGRRGGGTVGGVGGVVRQSSADVACGLGERVRATGWWGCV